MSTQVSDMVLGGYYETIDKSTFFQVYKITYNYGQVVQICLKGCYAGVWDKKYDATWVGASDSFVPLDRIQNAPIDPRLLRGVSGPLVSDQEWDIIFSGDSKPPCENHEYRNVSFYEGPQAVWQCKHCNMAKQ